MDEFGARPGKSPCRTGLVGSRAIGSPVGEPRDGSGAAGDTGGGAANLLVNQLAQPVEPLPAKRGAHHRMRMTGLQTHDLILRNDRVFKRVIGGVLVVICVLGLLQG